MSWTSVHVRGCQQLKDGSMWDEHSLLPRAQIASTVCLLSEADEGVVFDDRPLATVSQSTVVSPGWRRRGECRKRKGLVDEEFRPSPSKQLITEETVAAQLGSLYLDQQSVSCDAHSRLIQDDLDTEMNSVVIVEDCGEDSGSESDYGSSDETPSLELSKELKEHIQSCTDASLVPKKLVEQTSRPCMELVVWRPPTDFIQHVYSSRTDSPGEDTVNKHDNSTSKEVGKISSDFIDVDTEEEAPWDSDEMEI